MIKTVLKTALFGVVAALALSVSAQAAAPGQTKKAVVAAPAGTFVSAVSSNGNNGSNGNGGLGGNNNGCGGGGGSGNGSGGGGDNSAGNHNGKPNNNDPGDSTKGNCHQPVSR